MQWRGHATQVGIILTVRFLPMPNVTRLERLLVRAIDGIPNYYQVCVGEGVEKCVGGGRRGAQVGSRRGKAWVRTRKGARERACSCGGRHSQLLPGVGGRTCGKLVETLNVGQGEYKERVRTKKGAGAPACACAGWHSKVLPGVGGEGEPSSWVRGRVCSGEILLTLLPCLPPTSPNFMSPPVSIVQVLAGYRYQGITDTSSCLSAPFLLRTAKIITSAFTLPHIFFVKVVARYGYQDVIDHSAAFVSQVRARNARVLIMFDIGHQW